MDKVLENVLLDPVCGMTVAPESAAAKIEHDGKLWHFCSKGCAEKFSANPANYTSGAPKPQPDGHAGEYTWRNERICRADATLNARARVWLARTW